MVYYHRYFTIYINWFIYQRQGSGLYTKFTLKWKDKCIKKWKDMRTGFVFYNLLFLLNCTALCWYARDWVRLSEASIIFLFVWQTCIPNTILATLICAWALEAQMLLVDARIRPIAFVLLDQKHKSELLDSCLYTCYRTNGQHYMPQITVVWKYLRWRMGLFIN